MPFKGQDTKACSKLLRELNCYRDLNFYKKEFLYLALSGSVLTPAGLELDKWNPFVSNGRVFGFNYLLIRG